MNAWLQEAIERALIDEHHALDPLEQLSRRDGPTAEIEQMIAEIGAGRKRTDTAR